ncbi:C-type lectin domain family 12 member B-like isoform X2 [Plectropomus leopardus]|uniref:C-type lectin domain family 12 member B-like isoform X2 n=1 Tax=Plectropomus leopardus TaxID=160734 RepID=UPI001C4CEA33|nr:C-type lectin domain family 12 member B-like isoform X2 [Plectropomus leopardus]
MTCTSIMENSGSQSEPGDKMSFEHNTSQDFYRDGHSSSHRQTFGQERGGSAFPHQRLVILSLSMLNAVLLIAAVVIGIYCAQGYYLQAPNSAATPLIIEMNHLRNHSDVIRAKLEAQAALSRERASHAKLKLQVKHRMTLTDSLQGRIEALNTDKKNLQSNKTTLEESCGRCLEGWHLLKSSCYYYSHHVSKKNWPDSRANCISQGGDLLVIDNFEEQQLMINNFPKVRTSGMWWENGFWIGLTDVATAGTWVWINNVTEVETAYWKTGQPSRSGIQSGNCAAFYSYADNRQTLYNGNCADHLFNWICEMKPR